MKPIKSRTFLVQNMLVVAAVALALLGWFLSIKGIGFFPSVQAELVNGEIAIQLTRTFMPLHHPLLFLSFLCVYLVFEFYGFKPAFYTSINLVLAVALCFGTGLVLRNYVLDPAQFHTDLVIEQFFSNSKITAAVFGASLFACFALALVLAALIKTLTRNYLMFLRFPVAVGAGFFVFTTLNIYALNFAFPTTQEFMIMSAAPLSQFLVMILASVVPLYVLRLLLGIFRGWQGKESDSPARPNKKSLFKAAAQNNPPELEPFNESDAPLSENTVSQKIALNQPVQKPL